MFIQFRLFHSFFGGYSVFMWTLLSNIFIHLLLIIDVLTPAVCQQ